MTDLTRIAQETDRVEGSHLSLLSSTHPTYQEGKADHDQDLALAPGACTAGRALTVQHQPRRWRLDVLTDTSL